MIAIDMEMPSCCANCGMSYGLDKDSSCGCFITQGTNFDMYNSKLANCPLVEIVTCKDCKHREKVHPSYLSNKKDEVYFCTLQSDEYCYEVEDDHFCADAERRE